MVSSFPQIRSSHVLPAISFYGTICVEAGGDYSRSLLHVLYGSRKGKMTSEGIVSGLLCVVLAWWESPMDAPSTPFCYQGVL